MKLTKKNVKLKMGSSFDINDQLRNPFFVVRSRVYATRGCKNGSGFTWTQVDLRSAKKDLDANDDDDNKPVWPTWAVGGLSDAETYNRQYTSVIELSQGLSQLPIFDSL
jgi:hypothetical protein